MRLLWAYEHDFAAILPFLSERIGTLCRHLCSVLSAERTSLWRSGRSEGDSKSILFILPLVQGPAVPTYSKKEQFPFPPGSQVLGMTVCKRPASSLTSGQSRLGPREFGEDASEGTAFCIIHPYSLSLHHHRYVDCAVGAACTASGGMAHAAQPVSLAHNHSSTRLHDSVHQATSQFNCVLETLVAVRNAPVLREEIAVLLAKDAIEPVPPAEMRQGFHSPYFIVPKKGGQQPILDRRVLNRALHKLPFKMLTCSCIIKCIQPQDWFAAIDLKDAYIHVSILLWHRPFLRFAFEGRAW